MPQWEYCEVDFDGGWTKVFFYDEAGEYIDNPRKHPRLGVALAYLGHEGWEIVSTWWRSSDKVSYIMKREAPERWTQEMRNAAKERRDKSKKTSYAVPPGWD